MIRIKTSVKAIDARDIIEWTIQFTQNCGGEFEPTDEQLVQIADYCVAGQDAWESAAAVVEGRMLRAIKVRSRK